jgi:hypothetical protein
MKSDLHDRLENLHTELGRTQTVDHDSRQLLITLLSDITRVLQQSAQTVEEQQSLTERLDELAVQFEAEHPALGTAIRQVVDTLGKAGI